MFDDRFRYHKHLNPSEATDLDEVIDQIETGTPSSDRFYRPRSGQKDTLLEGYGVLHLHLGGDTSDTLLFLKQYSTHVVLLETNTHKRFWNDCQQFVKLHQLQPIAKPIVQHKKPPRLPRK